MKTKIFPILLLTIAVVACDKNQTGPIGPQESKGNIKGQSSSDAMPGMAAKYAYVSGNKVPDFDSGPNDPSCITGQGSCEEVIVIIESYTPLRVAGLSDAIDDSPQAVIAYLTESVISDLSEETNNTNVYNALRNVAADESNIIEVEMPSSEGKKKGFLIGEGTVSESNYEIAIVYSNL